MRTLLVVGEDEAVELALELGDRTGSALLGQVALERLVEAFDLAAGLGVIGPGVLHHDPELVEQGLEGGGAFTRPPLKMAPLSVSTEAG